MNRLIRVTSVVCGVAALYAVCAALVNETNPYLALLVLVFAAAMLVDCDVQDRRVAEVVA